MAGLNLTYFLSVAVWSEYGFTDSNTDVKKLKPIIQAVQRNRIEPVIGTILYNKLIELIDNDNVTGLYREVLNDHIIPTMIIYCDYKATFHTKTQITNKTTGQNNDEHISSATKEEANTLRAELMKDATASIDKLKGWICDNIDNVPELRECPEANKLKQTLRPNVSAPNDYYGSIGIL